jgi:hypothetical protein
VNADEPSVPRPRAAVDPTEQVQRYLRRLGIGLLLGSMAVDIAWQQLQRWRIQRNRWIYELQRQVDPPGPLLASAAVSILEATRDSRDSRR